MSFHRDDQHAGGASNLHAKSRQSTCAFSSRMNIFHTEKAARTNAQHGQGGCRMEGDSGNRDGKGDFEGEAQGTSQDRRSNRNRARCTRELFVCVQLLGSPRSRRSNAWKPPRTTQPMEASTRESFHNQKQERKTAGIQRSRWSCPLVAS